MARKRRKYDAEFKREAVRLVNEAGMTYTEVALDLGVNKSTIREWCQRADRGELERRGSAKPALSAEQELAQLRRRVRILEEEREILKKAAAFFAKETR